MTPTISAKAWIDCIQREYLAKFIRDGGASLKFVVPMDPESRQLVLAHIPKEAQGEAYQVASVCAADIRVHMIDQIFFCIASQINWKDLAQRVIERSAEKAGYHVDCEERSTQLFEYIAKINKIDAKVVLMELRQRLTSEVFKCRALSKDFRVAMFQLCMATLTGEPVGAADALIEWLTGRSTTIAAVKPYFIFNRIGRANARHLLESLYYWIRLAGYSGLIATLDISRLETAKNPKDGKVYYTKAAVLDAYEVFRQFVDATDRLNGCLMIVLAHENFVDEGTARGVSAYAALKLRIFDEVHDRRLVNPMSCLVRLKSAAN